jgi:hypothetical protein
VRPRPGSNACPGVRPSQREGQGFESVLALHHSSPNDAGNPSAEAFFSSLDLGLAPWDRRVVPGRVQLVAVEPSGHTAEDESGRDVPQGRKLLCVPVGLGEKHVVAAPLQHLGCSRLAIWAHFNLRWLLLPALIGLLIDLSHAYITTVSAGFVPSAAQLGCVAGQPTSRIACVG